MEPRLGGYHSAARLEVAVAHAGKRIEMPPFLQQVHAGPLAHDEVGGLRAHELSGVSLDEAHAIGKAVCFRDRAGVANDRRSFERMNPPGAGPRRHQGQDAGAGADVDHMIFRPNLRPDRSLEGHDASAIEEHAPMASPAGIRRRVLVRLFGRLRLAQQARRLKMVPDLGGTTRCQSFFFPQISEEAHARPVT